MFGHREHTRRKYFGEQVVPLPLFWSILILWEGLIYRKLIYLSLSTGTIACDHYARECEFGILKKKKQDKFDEFISPTKGYLRETCKSQIINPIYLTLSSPSVSFRS